MFDEDVALIAGFVLGPATVLVDDNAHGDHAVTRVLPAGYCAAPRGILARMRGTPIRLVPVYDTTAFLGCGSDRARWYAWDGIRVLCGGATR